VKEGDCVQELHKLKHSERNEKNYYGERKERVCVLKKFTELWK